MQKKISKVNANMKMQNFIFKQCFWLKVVEMLLGASKSSIEVRKSWSAFISGTLSVFVDQESNTVPQNNTTYFAFGSSLWVKFFRNFRHFLTTSLNQVPKNLKVIPVHTIAMQPSVPQSLTKNSNSKYFKFASQTNKIWGRNA